MSRFRSTLTGHRSVALGQHEGVVRRINFGRRHLRAALVASVLVAPLLAVTPYASAATHVASERASAMSETRLAATLKTNGVETSAIAPSITVYCPGSNCNVHDYWVMAYIASNGSNDIFVSTSTDNGSTWSTVNTGQQSKMTPSITQDQGVGCGELVIAYVTDNGTNDLMTTTSTNEGVTWNAPTLVGGRSSPQSSKTAPAVTGWDGDGIDNSNDLIMAYVANDSANTLIVTQGHPNTKCTAETWPSYATVGSPAQASKTAPSISFLGIIAYVANNSTNDLLVTSSSNGEGTDWSAPTLVGSPAQSSKTAPSLSWDFSYDPDLVDIAYVANNTSNDLIVTTSPNTEGTDWSPGALVGDTESSQAAPALPNTLYYRSIPMVYVANNSKDHLLLTTSDNAGTTWSDSSKIKD
jgi:hypothetical protein